MTENQIGNLIPPKMREEFDGVVRQRILGAGKHIEIIGRIFQGMAEDASDGAALFAEIQAVAAFFQETRGKASAAVGNAIRLLTRGIDAAQGGPLEEIRRRVLQNCRSYAAEAKANLDAIVAHTLRLARPYQTVMAFDYSSTVNAFLEAAPPNPRRVVLVPESRSIDGGWAYTQTCRRAGLRVRFLPDAAMWRVLPETDAVFIGAETFYADGTAFNTVGSDMLAALCEKLRVPYYVLTPMLKLDARAADGTANHNVVVDLSERLAGGRPAAERETVDFRCPELLPVPPRHITAYVTEYGAFPAAALREPIKLFLKKMDAA